MLLINHSKRMINKCESYKSEIFMLFLNNKRDLEQIDYYVLINGYKWPFLQRDSHGKIIHPKKYIPNSNFDEIKSYWDDKDVENVIHDLK